MEIIFFLIVLLFSVILHEIAHGSVALYLGDPTAKMAGRLTLNPIKHLDPVGSILLPLILIITTGKGIGWAKPVPINPTNFRDQKWGELKVSLAGPLANILLALIFGLILRFSSSFISPTLYQPFSLIVSLNLLLALFNLMPIPPLDGSHILFTFLPPSMDNAKRFFIQFGSFVLLFLILFIPWFFYFLVYVVNLIFFLIVGSPSL